MDNAGGPVVGRARVGRKKRRNRPPRAQYLLNVSFKGRRLGPYRLTKRVGEGSTGVVYRATSAARPGDLAVKTIRPGAHQGEHFADALVREAGIGARLEHPGSSGCTRPAGPEASASW